MTTAAPPERATMTAAEVAAYLGLSLQTIRRNPPVKPIQLGRRVLFPRAAVLAILGGSPVRTADLPAADHPAPPVAPGLRLAATRV